MSCNNFNQLRRNFPLFAPYLFKFICCLLIIVKSLVPCCKICSLLVAEVACCKKLLVTPSKICSFTSKFERVNVEEGKGLNHLIDMEERIIRFLKGLENQGETSEKIKK